MSLERSLWRPGTVPLMTLPNGPVDEPGGYCIRTRDQYTYGQPFSLECCSVFMALVEGLRRSVTFTFAQTSTPAAFTATTSVIREKRNRLVPDEAINLDYGTGEERARWPLWIHDTPPETLPLFQQIITTALLLCGNFF